MANVNPLNNGTVTGRLARDPFVNTNKDGSHTVKFTVIARQNWTKRDGTQGSDPVQLVAYFPANRQGIGIFEHVHKGDLVEVMYRVTTQSWADSVTGEMQYQTVLEVTELQMLESKEVTTARLQRRATEQNVEDFQQLPTLRQPRQVAEPTLQSPAWENTPVQPHFMANQGNAPF